MSNEIVRMTVSELASRIAGGTLSPVEVVDAYLARIETHNGRWNAYVTVAADAARREARALTEELARSGPRGPLHGIPLAVKDLQDTAGIRTTYGSSFFRDHVPAADAAPVARLRRAGMIVLGKTNTHEFACGVTTDNPHYGPTRNPWDPERVPGGSSGGSGAAVAGGLAPIATGTDTGGSIRVPAAVCGCVGIKPTHGRVSLTGTFPMASSFDHVGPIGRSARDCALALNAMAGFDADDPWSRRFPEEDFTRLLGSPLRGLRIGIDRDFATVPVEDSVQANLNRALAALRERGAEIVEISLPPASDVLTCAYTLIMAETCVVHAERFATEPGGYGADLRNLLAGGATLDGLTVAQAFQRREALARTFERAFAGVDALIMPTVAIEAPKRGTVEVSIGDFTADVTLVLASWTMVHNVSRLPTVAVPSGRGTEGLPTSVQISTAPGEEARALAIAAVLEEALWPAADRWPDA
jgi:aspartyl-tRNA(Asn)/glutamyl-tRNA(Gln) amidotransferase subunit A